MLASAEGYAQTGAGGYIIEAENSSGDWLTGPMDYTPYWDTRNLDLLPEWKVDRLYRYSYASGAYVTEENAVGASSTIGFTPPEPGYYLIGARLITREEEREDFSGQAHVTILMLDGDGEVIPNELEVLAKGYTWDVPVAAPVIGMWNLPAEPVTMVFQASISRLIFLDYFYLTPLFEARGAPRAYLPAVPWPAEGDWSWGNELDFMVTVSTMPGESSMIPLYASIAGDYLLYLSTWHDGESEQTLDLRVGAGGEAFTDQVTLPEGTYWKVVEMGPIALAEGETTLRFTNDPENPKDAPLAVEIIHMVPLGYTLDALPEGYRMDAVLRLDGLGGEWEDVPMLVSDPGGDQSLKSDIREVRAYVANGSLNLMVDFHDLSEHSGFVLDVDFDGNEEPEYCVEGSSEGRWALISYPDSWIHTGLVACSTFEVLEMSIPIKLLGPSIWEDRPDTLCPEFNMEAATGFHLRFRLTHQVEPHELDETEWAYIEIPDSWEGGSEAAEGEETGEDTGDITEEPVSEPSIDGEIKEEEPPEDAPGFIRNAWTMILKLLENLLSWIPS